MTTNAQTNLSGVDDPVNFIPAETFFSNAAASFKGPQKITSVNTSSSTDAKDPLRYALQLNFDDGTLALLQFVLPTIWRVRYDPQAKSVEDYPKCNT